MAEFHRKIELQAPEDLQYLISNVRRAANERIDKDLPPIEGEDPIRRRVEELVHDYITTVFQTASENLTINGLPPPSSLLSPSTAPPDDYIEVHEPLNNKLFERAKDLARQEEELVEEIAALRRSMPAVAVEKATVTYKEGMQEDEEGLRMMEERISAEEREGIELGVGKLERQPDMEANWTKAIMGLERLKKTMPETVAKKERAQRAENYVTASDRKG